LPELLQSPRLVDLILALVALEALALIVLWRTTGRGPAPGRLLPNLAAGACLLLALRGALAGAGAGWVGVSLAAALAAHVVDLVVRWRD